jgi:UDP-N-acetylmuramate--alanine ligase
MEEAFIDFSRRVKPGGMLLSKIGLPRGAALKADKHLTYGLRNVTADVFVSDVRIDHGSYEFEVTMKDWQLRQIKLNMGGMHNVENVTAAIAVAHQLGIADEKIKAAVEAFRGVKRRFEYIVKKEKLVFVDDYAHHPEELRALITGAKELFSGMTCRVIFQPHLFTRTRDFAAAFAEVLDMADEVILLPIYPARELPIEGVTSNIILDKMKNKHRRLMSKEEVLQGVRGMTDPGSGNKDFPPLPDGDRGRLLITAGAGDIDTLVQPIKKLIDPK